MAGRKWKFKKRKNEERKKQLKRQLKKQSPRPPPPPPPPPNQLLVSIPLERLPPPQCVVSLPLSAYKSAKVPNGSILLSRIRQLEILPRKWSLDCEIESANHEFVLYQTQCLPPSFVPEVVFSIQVKFCVIALFCVITILLTHIGIT